MTSAPLPCRLESSIAIAPGALCSFPCSAVRPSRCGMAEGGVPAAGAAAPRKSLCRGDFKSGESPEHQVCTFSMSSPGKRSLSEGGQCVWCSPDRMQAAMGNIRRMANLKTALSKFAQKSPAVYWRAVGLLRARLGEQWKLAVTPTKHCIGAGDRLCERSRTDLGRPARASKAGRLCARCSAMQRCYDACSDWSPKLLRNAVILAEAQSRGHVKIPHAHMQALAPPERGIQIWL